jgi:hypothetical protein
MQPVIVGLHCSRRSSRHRGYAFIYSCFCCSLLNSYLRFQQLAFSAPPRCELLHP